MRFIDFHPKSDHHMFFLNSDSETICFQVTDFKGFMLKTEGKEPFIIPFYPKKADYSGNDILWLLPESPTSTEKAIMIKAEGAVIEVKSKGKTVTVTLATSKADVRYFENRPACDFYGVGITLDIEDGPLFLKTFAAFYWDTMLSMVVEKTKALHFPYNRGYVLSTLKKGAYPGTYPDVDHEFQIKGRLAVKDALDLHVVQRMIELQIRVMKEDPDHLWRNPCSIQPNGLREYEVFRKSRNHKTKATMFLLTGNIEVIESAYHYYLWTKDDAWLRANIENLENIASFTKRYIDKDYNLWSDVYYEDQVMKDGRVAISQAFAANSFTLLAALERLLKRETQANAYDTLSKQLAKTLVAPLPLGYWDENHQRFIDWVDRKGVVHDHIHLLANSLPLTFGYANKTQTKAVQKLLKDHEAVFQKFPSFVAAKIEDYDRSEIGVAGPYDLCAAGRYWCWDAAYFAYERNGKKLHEQLVAVANQAELDHYIMGERYDMNYVYYKSKINWHGSGYYYEYPNVFTHVLVNEYLGVKPDEQCDLALVPLLQSYGKVALPNFGLAYEYHKDGFRLENLTDHPLSIRVDLAGLGLDEKRIVNLKPKKTVEVTDHGSENKNS